MDGLVAPPMSWALAGKSPVEPELMSASAKCAYCGHRKKKPKRLQKGMTMVIFERDPYCSRDCCEAAQAEEQS